MNETSLESLIHKHLAEFRQMQPDNAAKINKAIKAWEEENVETEFLSWLKTQKKPWLTALQCYIGWLWQPKGEIEYDQFESIYYFLTPVTQRSWSMPIVITTGKDDPLFEGGFTTHKFSIFQYKFSPNKQELIVNCQELPKPSNAYSSGLDPILDFLSFILGKSDFKLGFRQITSRRRKSSQTDLFDIGIGPELTTLPDYNFKQIENVLKRIKSVESEAGLSLDQLLHVRHRAILDSTLESKLIALWSSVEAQWGEETKEDRLLSLDEYRETKRALKDTLELEKFKKIVNIISKIKRKTKNDKIKEGIKKLQCANEWDVDATVKEIHSLRSKFAHGQIMSPNDQKKAQHYIDIMLQIIDELITQKLVKYNIIID
jgi:hypothetical protein